MGAFSSKGVSFDPQRDIPSLKNKVILVTGGTSGLGKQSILELAKHEPKTIWLGARNTTKAKETIKEIEAVVPGANIRILEMELSSLESVRSSAQTVIDNSDRLDILLLNAGIFNVTPGLTKDGYEIQFGTNHVGHAMLTRLLLPLLLKTAEQHGDVRVTVVSSAMHTSAPSGGIDFGSLKTAAIPMGGIGRYGHSKLANILFAKELAKRYPQLTVASLHPGAVNTGVLEPTMQSSLLLRIASKVLVPLLFVTPVKGALNQLWASTSKDVVSGTYYTPIGQTGQGSALTEDEALAKKLWGWTEHETGKFLRTEAK